MLLYRIENEKGMGPYYGQAIIEGEKLSYPWQTRNHNAEPNRPGINADFNLETLTFLYAYGTVKCGFSSLRQMLRWFTIKEIHNMYALGFRIVRVEPYYHFDSGKQVIYVERRK